MCGLWEGTKYGLYQKQIQMNSQGRRIVSYNLNCTRVVDTCHDMSGRQRQGIVVSGECNKDKDDASMTKKITKTIHVMTHERAKIGDCGHCGLLSLRNLAQASNSQQGLDLDLGFWIWLFM